jgi:ABC-type lipoprotein export system ATPase subunit
MIALRNVDKYYQTRHGRTYVLQGILLDVRAGEFVTVMGPSGAGKSTLLSILGMLDADYHGEFHFLGQPVHELRNSERARLGRENIGFVFQQYHLLDDLTVRENLMTPLAYRGLKSAEAAALVADALDRFQIVGKKDLYPSQLSGGQQQLVGVARAVVARPRLILADEPTGNLHSAQGREVMQLFRMLNESGTTIIQVTHSEENAGYGHRVINLRDGWIASDEVSAGNAPALAVQT